MSGNLQQQSIATSERIVGGLWGALVGDALGVPVEFSNRASVQSNPVTGMREYGTHNQPKGTWSDDGALTLCTVDSLVHHEFSTEDMAKRFLAWYQRGLWAARGVVFDVGIATERALRYVADGLLAEMAGGDSESSNGNGSLMRIAPVALRCFTLPTALLLDRIHRASAITHRHPRSQIACGFYALMIRELLHGLAPQDAYRHGLSEFRKFYGAKGYWAVELEPFQLLLNGDLNSRAEVEIDSGGYVVDTLIASVWCLLNTENYQQCVLKAVNLGGDTDTTGCVAGGLAGVAYGLQNIPREWTQTLPRQDELNRLFAQFTKLKPLI